VTEDKPVASVTVVFESSTDVVINSVVPKACEEVTTVTTAGTPTPPTTPFVLGKTFIK